MGMLLRRHEKAKPEKEKLEKAKPIKPKEDVKKK